VVVVDVDAQTVRSGETTDGPEPRLDDGSASAQAAEDGAPGRQQDSTPARARLTVALGAGDTLHVWDDRVTAAAHEYPFDDWFGVRLVPDPRAPLTINPPLAVALTTHNAHWATYAPPNEHDAVQAVAAIREACQRLGIEPIGIDDEVQLPELPTAEEPLLYRWEAPKAEEQTFNTTESVLLALVHASTFYFPVALPVFVWYLLRKSVPAVAAQAREAAEFQGVLCALTLPIAIYAARLVGGVGMQPASVLSVLAVSILVVLGATFSFTAAYQALRGRGFSYRDFARTRQVRPA
jgi:uncharacterized Tic20 family protein